MAILELRKERERRRGIDKPAAQDITGTCGVSPRIIGSVPSSLHVTVHRRGPDHPKTTRQHLPIDRLRASCLDEGGAVLPDMRPEQHGAISALRIRLLASEIPCFQIGYMARKIYSRCFRAGNKFRTCCPRVSHSAGRVSRPRIAQQYSQYSGFQPEVCQSIMAAMQPLQTIMLRLTLLVLEACSSSTAPSFPPVHWKIPGWTVASPLRRPMKGSPVAAPRAAGSHQSDKLDVGEERVWRMSSGLRFMKRSGQWTPGPYRASAKSCITLVVMARPPSRPRQAHVETTSSCSSKSFLG